MKYLKWVQLAVPAVIFILCSTGVFSQSSATNDHITAFKNIRVFDGKTTINHFTVIIRGTSIIQIGKNITVPEDAEVISGEDLTLLPGLIDSHVHIFTWGDLRLDAIFGVTTVCDMMTTNAFVAQTKEMLRNNTNNDMADLLSSGQPATCPGGHGTEWGTEIGILTKPEEAAGFIEEDIAAGSDYIKIMYGENQKILSREIMAAVAAEAKKRNLLTLVHIETRSRALEAIEAGVNGLAHCFADVVPDEGFIKIMKEKNAFVIPTLSVMNALEDARVINIAADRRFADYLTPEVLKALSKERKKQKNYSYKVAEETAYILHKAGIRVLAGTDAYNPGTIAGASLHGELELLTRAGFTPLEALRAATSLPAETFGLKDRGRIEKGLRADLVLVKGNPLEDITGTRNIIGVWIKGKKLDRDSYLAEMQKLQKEWKETGEIPAPLHSESGEICNFDNGNFSPNFGFFFFEMSDKLMGGASQALIGLATDGAEGTSGSLAIKGEISGNSPFPWAGAAFFPSAMETSVADLSKWNTLTFWAKGDSAQMLVMLLLNGQQMPGFQTVTISNEWKQYEIEFSKLGSPDGKNIMAMIFGSNAPGKFDIRIDQLKLIRKNNP
jgi:imidazolonepropionase-like amidohydrolase